MNILSIGNSFSEDAHRYINGIARSLDDTVNTYNLYIGGCPLCYHFRNHMGDEKRYYLGVNGHNTFFQVTIKEALLACDWDVVTLQQVSHLAIDYETYQPYLSELVSEVRKLCPKAKIALQQTWAYEEGSERLIKELGYEKRHDMFADIKKAYEKAAQDIKADFVIPSGALMEKLTECGIEKVHRDTFHASMGLGRYAIGLMWYSYLTGKSIDDVDFCDFDEEVSQAEIEIAKKAVNEVKKENSI